MATRVVCRCLIALLLLLASGVELKAQEDRVAKAQSERELIVYGTALAG